MDDARVPGCFQRTVYMSNWAFPPTWRFASVLIVLFLLVIGIPAARMTVGGVQDSAAQWFENRYILAELKVRCYKISKSGHSMCGETDVFFQTWT